MTHRAFSRNASSSRAIPGASPDRRGPARHGGAHAHRRQPGRACRRRGEVGPWRGAGLALGPLAGLGLGGHGGGAALMARLGIHKQVVNRVLEPWSHITVVCTASRLQNFFALRHHPMAQPEIFELARRMRAAMDGQQPRSALPWGAWHLPFVTGDERQDVPLGQQVKLSAARCARVSYLTHEGQPPRPGAKDLALHARLLSRAAAARLARRAPGAGRSRPRRRTITPATCAAGASTVRPCRTSAPTRRRQSVTRRRRPWNWRQANAPLGEWARRVRCSGACSRGRPAHTSWPHGDRE